METVEVPERQSNTTSCGLKQQNALHGLENISQVLEGTILQERKDNNEENEKDLRSVDCYGNGTWYEHDSFCR